MKIKYYSLKQIKSKNAQYNVIFGERSNGKTYAVIKDAFIDFLHTGGELAVIRRWEEDFTGEQSARTLYKSMMCNGKGENEILTLSDGQYTGVEYYAGIYYLTAFDEKTQKNKRTDKIIARGFALTSAEHYKSASFPNIKTVLFDEFITRKLYLPDEFMQFQSILSTIIRLRTDVTIYMCGNTVNKYGCPYFREMGLYRIKEMKQGEIDVYTYGDTGLTVAVEWADGMGERKPNNFYFAFDNPKLNMIKTGAWEMDIYPHCPCKYIHKDIIFMYFIIFEEITLQCEIIKHDDMFFTFIHRKTGEIKRPDKDIIYTPDYVPKANYRRKITVPVTKLDRKIYWFYQTDKVYYADNETGEIVRNYLNFCES